MLCYGFDMYVHRRETLGILLINASVLACDVVYRNYYLKFLIQVVDPSIAIQDVFDKFDHRLFTTKRSFSAETI